MNDLTIVITFGVYESGLYFEVENSPSDELSEELCCTIKDCINESIKSGDKDNAE